MGIDRIDSIEEDATPIPKITLNLVEQMFSTSRQELKIIVDIVLHK
jgi:hypothetical protein